MHQCLREEYHWLQAADEALAGLALLSDDIPNRIPKLASLSGDLMVEFV